MQTPKQWKKAAKLVFAVSAGVLLSRSLRRKLMLWIVMITASMLFLGSVIFDAFLLMRPLLFLLFWAICGFLTLFLVLLAMYDILMVRKSERLARRKLQNSLLKEVKNLKKP